MLIFDHTHLKIIEATFSFPDFVTTLKKSAYAICAFLRYSQFYSPVTRLATPIFDQTHLKFFWWTFNLFEFVSTCEKPGYFICFFWRYGWLKNSAIWMAENILANISRTKIFPKMGFVEKHSK